MGYWAWGVAGFDGVFLHLRFAICALRFFPEPPLAGPLTRLKRSRGAGKFMRNRYAMAALGVIGLYVLVGLYVVVRGTVPLFAA